MPEAEKDDGMISPDEEQKRVLIRSICIQPEVHSTWLDTETEIDKITKKI
jgi:hypothetical protein